MVTAGVSVVVTSLKAYGLINGRRPRRQRGRGGTSVVRMCVVEPEYRTHTAACQILPNCRFTNRQSATGDSDWQSEIRIGDPRLADWRFDQLGNRPIENKIANRQSQSSILNLQSPIFILQSSIFNVRSVPAIP